ncbi:hypothetical protein FE257_002004 [Aspergillus nanangensis]|uniref:Uncharacterized protein n=1 Tax=Aspergillus nanangensis TaxID=2582783 RepID=A0AAD4GY40_ASPNN|nr:hypothetical protein FE257_002004 [Aspergillus nanangensis]
MTQCVSTLTASSKSEPASATSLAELIPQNRLEPICTEHTRLSRTLHLSPSQSVIMVVYYQVAGKKVGSHVVRVSSIPEPGREIPISPIQILSVYRGCPITPGVQIQTDTVR